MATVQWEYRIYEESNMTEVKLNELGNAGWENYLILPSRVITGNDSYNGTYFKYYFKRIKQ